METMQELKAKSFDVIQKLNQIDMFFRQQNDEMNIEYQKQVTPLRMQLDELNAKMRALDAIKPVTVSTLKEPVAPIEKDIAKKLTAKKKVSKK